MLEISFCCSWTISFSSFKAFAPWEIGFVGYENGDHSKGTDPKEAERFALDTGIDAMAISCGNLHLKQNKEGELDIERIKEIEKVSLQI